MSLGAGMIQVFTHLLGRHRLQARRPPPLPPPPSPRMPEPLTVAVPTEPAAAHGAAVAQPATVAAARS